MQPLDLLKNLVVMAIADGSLSESELALLSDRCIELGISETDLQHALSTSFKVDASLKLSDDPAQQKELLSDLIRMMAADGQLTESEKRLFAFAAAKMNFDAEQVDFLIDRLVPKESDTP